MSRFRIGVAAVLATLTLVVPTQAQSLAPGLFDRYLDALRQELGIPGLSAAIVQNGTIMWERGFGVQEITQNLPATPDTPYPLLNISETIASALLLRDCIDSGEAELSDRVTRWTPFPDTATLGQTLAHVSADGVYKYDPNRFGMLDGVVKQCGKQPYARLVGTEVPDRFGMTWSVPGRDAVIAPNSSLFTAATLAAYNSVLQRLAVPYRVDPTTKRATRTDYTSPALNAATGIVSTAHDLAKFDAALGDGFVSPELLDQAWRAGANRSTGLGWFVQPYNNEKLVWHFGVQKDAYSSMILKLPARRLTLILLANSDGLATSLNTAQPDVTQSIFARLFLKLFVG